MNNVHSSVAVSQVQVKSVKFLKIFKLGPLIYLSSTEDGTGPTPDELVMPLHDQLSYRHRRFLYGREAYASGGGKKKIEFTEKRLYSHDGGRIVTSFGFIRKVVAAAQQLGISVSYCDLDEFRDRTKPHPRPDRNTPNWNNVTRCFSFREMQKECLQAVVDSPWGLVDATMGFGKMVLIVMLCLLFNRAKIHVVSKRIPVVINIVNYLTKYIPNVGQVGGGSRSMGNRITVFSCDSLEHSDFDADILLIDEIHETVTDSYLPLFAKYRRARRFGFTGTSSGRTDGSDIRIEAVVGPSIFYLPYPEAQRLGLVVPIEVRWRDVRLSHNPAANRSDEARMKYGIWLNSDRNDLIADTILETPKDEQKLALTRTIYHAAELYRRLRSKMDVTLIYDKLDNNRYINLVSQGVLPADLPKMTPSLKEKYLRKFEAGEGNYIATTTWEVGIDPTYLQHLFVVDSFSSSIKASQGPARASRLNSKIGKTCGYVHDFRDHFDDKFFSAGKTRSRTYGRLGWSQVLWSGGEWVDL